MSPRPPRVLALSSGGGHWIELLRLRPAFAGAELHFASVNEDYRADVADARFHRIPDATRWNKLALLRLLWRLLWLLLRVRPDVIVTTGAAPGYLAIRLGRLLRARTIWLDSIANVDELSLSGRMAGKHADLWLTQWEHLATPEGPQFQGAVL
ncbi:MAG: UDP-N-acetylglucosamine--LPS N-acetylglucosamine transferase [Planctomycetes bacterium]|nr:UDP-N-acetylglucosamine--LPS N-acetylglucosamine transferase [Planctomycetota bacterium]